MQECQQKPKENNDDEIKIKCPLCQNEMVKMDVPFILKRTIKYMFACSCEHVIVTISGK